MGDFRASVKISWSCCGVEDSCDMWINYDRNNHIDDRIDDFFERNWSASKYNMEREIREARISFETKQREEFDIQEYKRLKEKFGD